MTPADRLRQIKSERGITSAYIASVCGVSIKTVESWLAAPGTASHRNMPERQLRAFLALSV